VSAQSPYRLARENCQDSIGPNVGEIQKTSAARPGLSDGYVMLSSDVRLLNHGWTRGLIARA